MGRGELNRTFSFFLELLQVSLGISETPSWVPSSQEWQGIWRIAKEQAIVGVLIEGIERLPSALQPPESVLIQWIGRMRRIARQNEIKNEAVVELCKESKENGTQILVVKGQTLAALYPNKYLRQSGDIDYLVCPDDWSRAYQSLISAHGESVRDANAEKHIEWRKDEVLYEMHHELASFAYPKHQRYWKSVIEKEIWENPWTVDIEGYAVPTLSPVYNVLYVFVHLFEHFIKEGIGLRHLVDWYYLIKKANLSLGSREALVLENHLKALGLRNAFTGFGAILTDYMGLTGESFPFEITDKNHRYAPSLMENILEMGNLGHNKGAINGFSHIGRIWSQAWQFGHYAPSEVWWRIPHMFVWWVKKLLRIIKR